MVGLDTDGAWDTIRPVISSRPINWELIAQQYDELVKYATALKLRINVSGVRN